ncbi:hypothetical protein Ciccas_011293 [Cichlidogyrus casuarinus]|uniref:Uncharacterized protein n=1 Tax=Cichlidogyrus casuarinus TaxID=1844966 RepID=A0ABD2PWE7_9PLAT
MDPKDGVKIFHQYSKNGTYSVTIAGLYYKNDKYFQPISQLTVFVHEPVGTFTFEPNGRIVTVGVVSEIYVKRVTGLDSNENNLTVNWGDQTPNSIVGAFTNNHTLTHTFKDYLRYNVTATVDGPGDSFSFWAIFNAKTVMSGINCSASSIVIKPHESVTVTVSVAGGEDVTVDFSQLIGSPSTKSIFMPS